MAYKPKEIEEIFNEICRQIAEEGKSLRSVLLSDNMPTSQTFYKWVDSSEEKTVHYVRATDKRADLIFEEILHIADTPKEGTTTKETEKGVEITTGDMIQHRRLQVDARKWMLGKMNPKKYSDKNTTIHEGGDQPIQTIVSLGGGTKPE